MKDSSLQHLKALMLLGVVVNHAWAAQQYINTPQIPSISAVSWFSNVLIISGLPAFFFLSGYFAAGKSNAVLTLAGYRDFMLKKVRSLMVPYLAWNLFFIVFYIALASCFPRLSDRVGQKGLTTVSGFLDSLLGLSSRPIDSPLWFVRDLFLIFCCMPVIVWTLKRIKWIWPILLVAFVMFPSIFGRILWGNWYSIFCLTAGLWVGMVKFDLHRLEKYCKYLMPVWVLASIAHFVYWRHCGTYHADIKCTLAFFALSIVTWMSMLKLTERFDGSWFARFVTPASFFIFGGHFLVCSCCLHVVAGKVPDAPWKLAALYAVFLCIGVPLLLALYQLGKKFCPRVLSVFVGGRVE